MKKAFLLLSALLIGNSTLNAQHDIPPGHFVVFGTVYHGDTIPITFLNEVSVIGYISPLSKAERKKYAKLIRNVKKVYPYAKVAGKKLEQYNTILQATQSDARKKKIMKQAEKDIENQFGDELKKLNKSQGKILLKLIDRETGSDSYALVKELRGTFRAFFYQTFAKIFGYDLKVRYSPQTNEEDRIIERIIFAIESGTL